MAGKQAKILSADAFDSLLAYASSTRQPLRNTVIVLLSVKAGLRAGEIANLTWPMALDANGEFGRTVALHDKAAKKGSGRSIPLHPQLAEALDAWADQSMHDGHIITSERGGRMTALSIVLWFRKDRPEGLLVTFRPARLHHPRGNACPQGGVHISDRQLEADTIVAADGAGALHRYAFAARCAAHRYWKRPDCR